MKLYLFFLLLFISYSTHCQELTWKTLADVKWERRYNKEYDEYINYPKFGEKVKQVKDKEVVISGYLLPVEVECNYIVVSALPFQSCFFCGGGGIETVMEVYLKKHRKIKANKIKVKGKLVLNSNDVEHLVYLLKEAEIVE
ncbi:MAG: DUF3299 domain-containing protein [Thermoflexibacter sp.]|jgi:hypothetical protein|nr:DUF3299 domain-containing protein [Thermoflexibacter sp.]